MCYVKDCVGSTTPLAHGVGGATRSRIGGDRRGGGERGSERNNTSPRCTTMRGEVKQFDEPGDTNHEVVDP